MSSIDRISNIHLFYYNIELHFGLDICNNNNNNQYHLLFFILMYISNFKSNIIKSNKVKSLSQNYLSIDDHTTG